MCESNHIKSNSLKISNRLKTICSFRNFKTTEQIKLLIIESYHGVKCPSIIITYVEIQITRKSAVEFLEVCCKHFHNSAVIKSKSIIWTFVLDMEGFYSK